MWPQIIIPSDNYPKGGDYYPIGYGPFVGIANGSSGIISSGGVGVGSFGLGGGPTDASAVAAGNVAAAAAAAVAGQNAAASAAAAASGGSAAAAAAAAARGFGGFGFPYYYSQPYYGFNLGSGSAAAASAASRLSTYPFKFLTYSTLISEVDQLLPPPQLLPFVQPINLNHSPCIIHLTSMDSILEVALLLMPLLSLGEPSLVESDLSLDTNTRR